jgi:hypothetical protein
MLVLLLMLVLTVPALAKGLRFRYLLLDLVSAVFLHEPVDPASLLLDLWRRR